ncbi:hypothetical protein OS493_031613 [Desmophyllum pertusum]|uniref:Uncharacterized protein n=1 Tax=Desmophyllum pertusum TaxID=174260 RepID=A0A9W9YJP8_9CNID|nr:hypothetical protein OS493_031613 [Desmophyllum pertusum]
MEELCVYKLSKYNFYQIINQRCTQTYDLLQKGVLTKLYFRAQRLKEIPLYSLLYERASASPAKDKKKKRGSLEPTGRPMVSMWTKKILEVKHMNKLTGMTGKTERPPAKTATTVDNGSHESGSSGTGESKSDVKKPEKKAGPKQYTVDEFLALKKKMQAQGKIVLRALD